MRARFAKRCLLTVSNSSSMSSAVAVWLPAVSLSSEGVPKTWLHKIELISKIEGKIKESLLVVELNECCGFLLIVKQAYNTPVEIRIAELPIDIGPCTR